MGLAPLADALDLERATEILPVGGFVQPTTLAGGLAGLTARGLGAVALARGAPRVRSKEDLTMLTLALTQWTSHGPVSPQAHDPWSGAWKEENGETTSELKKSEAYGRRG